MLKIIRVGIVGDDMLDVQLSNGNIVMLELTPLLSQPRFALLQEDDRILYPKTDGSSVYWRDGPRLPVDEFLDMLLAENSNKHNADQCRKEFRTTGDKSNQKSDLRGENA